MQNNDDILSTHNDDILSAFEITDEALWFEDTIQQQTPNNSQYEWVIEQLIPESWDFHNNISTNLAENFVEKETITRRKKSLGKKKLSMKIKETFIFLLKYFSTSICIFWILMVWVNYSAYWNIAYSIIYAEEMQVTKNSLIDSVDAGLINEKNDHTSEINTFKNISSKAQETTKKVVSMHSMSQLTSHPSQSWVDLWIEITPYENRVVIPAIGKNIPLVDIKQKKVQWVSELNDIFMEELENWVVRYPGSAKPGEEWNSFIFGHSSNLPWLEWEYNDVFALLDNVDFDDEVVVYYGQEKHTYKIKSKTVISPGDVSILRKKVEDDKSQITLMTCWPIGTTLNRLVLTWELISVE